MSANTVSKSLILSYDDLRCDNIFIEHLFVVGLYNIKQSHEIQPRIYYMYIQCAWPHVKRICSMDKQSHQSSTTIWTVNSFSNIACLNIIKEFYPPYFNHGFVLYPINHSLKWHVINSVKLSSTFHIWKFSSMMTSSNGNIFRVTGHLCGEFTGHRWITCTKASDAELWCFLWSTPE